MAPPTLLVRLWKDWKRFSSRRLPETARHMHFYAARPRVAFDPAHVRHEVLVHFGRLQNKRMLL